MRLFLVICIAVCLIFACFSGSFNDSVIAYSFKENSADPASTDPVPTDPNPEDLPSANPEISPEEILASQPVEPEMVFNETASQKDIDDYNKILAFQKRVVPIIEETLNKVLSSNGNIGSELDKLTDYYFDNSNTDDLKVVFMVAKEDHSKMKAIRAELKNKLGKKEVVFKKAKKSVVEFRKMQKEVADYVEGVYDGNFTVGYDVIRQSIDLELGVANPNIQSFLPQAALSSSEIDFLEKSIGSEYLNITKTDDIPSTTLARDYPYTNIGGGQELRVFEKDDKSKTYLCSSGYVATKDNQAYLVTAGHCLKNAATNQTTYDVKIGNATNGYKSLGYEHWSGYNGTQRYDLGLIRLTNPGQYITSRFYTDGNGGGINGQLKQRLVVSDDGIRVGLVINKSGITTGITGATITKTGTWANSYNNKFQVLAIEADLRPGTGKLINNEYNAVAGSGDSGSTVYRALDYALVGVQSGIPDAEYPPNPKPGEKVYDNQMYISPAWYANSLLGAITQYTSTTDIPVSSRQGQ